MDLYFLRSGPAAGPKHKCQLHLSTMTITAQNLPARRRYALFFSWRGLEMQAPHRIMAILGRVRARSAQRGLARHEFKYGNFPLLQC